MLNGRKLSFQKKKKKSKLVYYLIKPFKLEFLNNNQLNIVNMLLSQITSTGLTTSLSS